MTRIMILDDEPNVYESLQRVFRCERPNWEIETFDDPRMALRRAQTSLFDVFISDFRMPLMTGVEFLSEVCNVQPEAIRIILSGQIDVGDLLGAINESRIDRLVLKPADPVGIALTVDLALDHREVLVENRRLANHLRSLQAKHQLLAAREGEAVRLRPKLDEAQKNP